MVRVKMKELTDLLVLCFCWSPRMQNLTLDAAVWTSTGRMKRRGWEKRGERERERAKENERKKDRETKRKKGSAAKGAEPEKGKGSSTWGNRGWGPDHNITEEPAEWDITAVITSNNQTEPFITPPSASLCRGGKLSPLVSYVMLVRFRQEREK